MNEIERQRLVDGEYDDQQQATLLASLGDEVDQWRELAIELLEEQRLRKYFANEFAAASSGSHAIAGEPSAEHRIVVDHGLSQTYYHRLSLAVLAASLLFIVVGVAAYYKSLNQNKDLATGTSNQVTQLVPTTSDTEREWLPVGHLQVSLSPGSSEVWEMPVYEAPLLAPEVLAAEDASRLMQVNSQLNRRGWNANVNTLVYEGELEDGRRMILPVNVVRVEPLGY